MTHPAPEHGAAPAHVLTPARAVALTGALSILIALALAAPVLVNPTTQIFGFELVGRHHDPFTVMEQYAAGGVPQPYLQPGTDLAGIALSRLTGSLTAYNALVIITFPLSALAAYAHARHFISSPFSAVVAGVLFMMAPFHLAHSAYHLHLAQVQWLPLFFLALWRLLERPSLGRAIGLAAALSLVALSSFYFGFVTVVVSVPAALTYTWLARQTESASPRTSLGWAVATLAIVCSGLLLVIWMAVPQVIQHPGVFAFPEEALDQHSARWWSYLLPPAGHVLFGDISSTIWRSRGIDRGLLEQQLSLGSAVIALAVIPLVNVRTTTGRVFTSGQARALAATAIVAGVCSLPPTVHLGWLALPMPSAVLHAVAPMFRAYARFGIVVSLMTTTLAGGGLALLLARRSPSARAVAIGLLAIVAVEYFPPLPTSRDVLPTSAHRWLADNGPVRLFDCTTPSPGATAGLSWLMQSEVSFPAGPLSDCADPELGAKLAGFGFTHLLVRHESETGAWLSSGGRITGVRKLQSAADASVYEVVASKPPLYTTEISGFFPREYRGSESWQWMGPAGAMTIVTLRPQTMTGTLELELEAYDTTRRLRVSIDEQYVDTIVAAPARQTATTGPFTLTPGNHAIRFEADGTSIPALRVRDSGDDRRLSVRFFRWEWHSAPIEPGAP